MTSIVLPDGSIVRTYSSFHSGGLSALDLHSSYNGKAVPLVANAPNPKTSLPSLNRNANIEYQRIQLQNGSGELDLRDNTGLSSTLSVTTVSINEGSMNTKDAQAFGESIAKIIAKMEENLKETTVFDPKK